MKKTDAATPISKALSEVWEWKDEVYKDTKDMSFDEKRKYFDRSFKKAVKTLNGKLKTNSDGSYSITR